MKTILKIINIIREPLVYLTILYLAIAFLATYAMTFIVGIVIISLISPVFGMFAFVFAVLTDERIKR